MKLSMRLFSHRGIWYVEVNGQRRSLRTRDKAEAKIEYAKIRKSWLAGKLSHLTQECQKTFKDYRDEFLAWAEGVQPKSTYRANRLALDKLMHFAGERTTLDRVSLKHLDQLIADSLKKGLSTTSVNVYIRHARAALNKAKDWGYVQRNPLTDAKELPAPRMPPAFLDKDMVQKFMNSINDVDLRRIAVAYLVTGRRRSELLNLRWSDVDFGNLTYTVRCKGGDIKRFKINSMFAAVLRSVRKQNSVQGRVFTRWSHPDTISHYIKKALIASGYGHLRLHHLRHTFASLQVMSGKTLLQVQSLLGHSEFRTTEIYAHLSDEYVSDAAEIHIGPVDLGD